MMYRFNIRARTRKDTQGAGDLVRYLQRQGEFAPKVVGRDRDVEYMTRTRPDTLNHDDLVGEPMVGNLPAWAEGDAGKFFSAASRHERANGRYALALQIALPCGLSHEQHMMLAQDFAAVALHDKPYLIVKHEPVHQGQSQPHLHILMSTRTIDGIERDEMRFFRRYNPDAPGEGGAQKDPFWNQRQAPARLRQSFADLANRYLEMSGVDERIDPRSLWKQGLERKRISWSNKIELDHATKAREQAKAREAWEQRKVHRGLENIWAISREGMVAHVRDWTRQVTPGKALERSSPEVVLAWLEKDAQRLTREKQGYERELHEVGRRRLVLEYREGYGEVETRQHAMPSHPRVRHSERETAPGRERAGRTTRELDDITVPTLDPEKPHGRAVRTRVFDRERESR